ncbi:MAG: hypothetical protein KDD42_08870, partial [Bdellovibrionales bacterium]|nr:hypothetical protein [Bdellovibrionales bacterium]
MPELPEVETVIRLISRDVIGREILSTNIRWKRSIAVPSAAAFNRGLRGMRVEGLSRRGKYIIFSLRDNLGANWSMLVHLRMSGTLEVRHAPGELAKHDRVIFQFENGSQLHFNDTRKFGNVYLVREHRQVTAKLGPEPLTNELSYGRFYDRLQSRSGAIKPLLLKQDFIAGLGNIY